MEPRWVPCVEIMRKVRRDALQSVLLVAAVLPSLAADRVWLVTVNFGTPRHWYRLVEVGLATGRI
jgi:hypothetical protein